VQATGWRRSAPLVLGCGSFFVVPAAVCNLTPAKNLCRELRSASHQEQAAKRRAGGFPQSLPDRTPEVNWQFLSSERRCIEHVASQPAIPGRPVGHSPFSDDGSARLKF